MKRIDFFAPDENSQIAPEERGWFQLRDALKSALYFVKTKRRLPRYLEQALIRFIATEQRRRDLIMLCNAVDQAEKDGHPKSETPGRGKRSAFEVAGEKMGFEAANVAKIYYNAKSGGVPAFPGSAKPRKK